MSLMIVFCIKFFQWRTFCLRVLIRRQVTFTNKNDPQTPTLTQVDLAFLRTYTRISMLTRLIIIKVLKYLQPLHKPHIIIVLKQYILTSVPVPTTTSCLIQTKSSTTHYEYSNIIVRVSSSNLVLACLSLMLIIPSPSGRITPMKFIQCKIVLTMQIQVCTFCRVINNLKNLVLLLLCSYHVLQRFDVLSHLRNIEPFNKISVNKLLQN